MKLISLNIWYGKLSFELSDFIRKHKDDTDIFCFQEVYEKEDNISKFDPDSILTFQKIQEILTNHIGYFEDYVAPGKYDKMGLATFIRKDIQVNKTGEIFVYNPPDMGIANLNPQTLWRNMQYLECAKSGKDFLIANLHGLFDFATKTRKEDTPDRLKQSERVRELLDKYNCPKLLCGDFNLWPKTESLKILAEGMRDLIKEFNITSTRSSFFNFDNKYADYTLVSLEIKINNFKILNDVVSDHLAMYLDFE